jgi:hypothetical protein
MKNLLNHIATSTNRKDITPTSFANLRIMLRMRKIIMPAASSFLKERLVALLNV